MKPKHLLLILFSFLSTTHPTHAFFDVNEESGNYDAIEYARSENIVSGYEDNSFRPKFFINRVEFLKIIVETIHTPNEIESCDPKEFHFSDTSTDQWYAPYICVGKREGIISGVGDGRYLPDQYINFAEAAKIISIAYGKQVSSDSIWYKPYVEDLTSKKAIPKSIERFCEQITREEMVQIIYRLETNQGSEASQDFNSLEANGNCPKPHQLSSDTIPVVMYHYVRFVDRGADPLGYNLSVEPPLLDQQLEWLKKNDIQTTSIAEITNRKKAPENSVVLLFDDGYKDFYEEAYPLFKKHELTATIAVITEKINAPGYLSEDDIRHLLKEGFEIVSHTHTHRELPSLSADDLNFELQNSQEILKNQFGVSTTALVYPVGRYSQSVMQTAEQYYDIAFTTEYGTVNLNSNWLSLPRIRIDNRSGLDGFIKKITEAY